MLCDNHTRRPYEVARRQIRSSHLQQSGSSASWLVVYDPCVVTGDSSGDAADYVRVLVVFDHQATTSIKLSSLVGKPKVCIIVVRYRTSS